MLACEGRGGFFFLFGGSLVVVGGVSERYGRIHRAGDIPFHYLHLCGGGKKNCEWADRTEQNMVPRMMAIPDQRRTST